MNGAADDGKKPVELTDEQVKKVRDYVVDEVVKGRIDRPQTKDKNGAMRDVTNDELPSRVRKTFHDAVNRPALF